MNVEIFKSKIRGLAVTNRYRITIPYFSYTDDTYVYLAKNVTLPSRELKISESIFWGAELAIPIGQDFDSISITFLSDAELKIRKNFDSWMNKIVNPSTWNVSFLDDIKTDIQVDIFNKKNIVVDTILVETAFPTNIGEVSLSYEDDSPYEFTVTFNFFSWRHKTK